jgi:hypothetical protein
MEPNSSIKQETKILQELQKTGYPTEIVSASLMQWRGWGVIHNPTYLDDSEDRSREFDIRAYKSFDFEDGRFSIGVYLITECKKSEKPWVFFMTPERYLQSRLGQLINGQIKINLHN